jgi:glycerol-3-phosphate dehydrogenase (NAD(P)+)
MARVAVLGAGAWGTAIACVLAPRHDTLIYARDAGQTQLLRTSRTNARYLPGVALPATLAITDSLDAALAHAADGLVLIATPTRALREIVGFIAAARRRAHVGWLCKGFEEGEPRLAHEAVAAVWPAGRDVSGPVSGPSFAQEVVQGLPTALTVAGAPGFCAAVTQALHADALRIYSSDDVVGVEVGGTVKNVLAIATGISDALMLGLNARAALLTRGLAEMTRLGVALGARPETFMGLAGVGDLILTATGDLSRNRRVGLALGRGQSVHAIVAELGHVAEGVRSAPAVLARARALGVQMPIVEGVCAVLDGRATPREALSRLLARDPKRESALS